jgi:hypothetical protein
MHTVPAGSAPTFATVGNLGARVLVVMTPEIDRLVTRSIRREVHDMEALCAAHHSAWCANPHRFGRFALSTASVRHVTDRTPALGPNRQWIERIKDLGNDANHELNPIEPDVAIDVATFTEQPLVLAYELDALMADPKLAE